MIDKRFTENTGEIDVNKIREQIIIKKRNELLNLYSNSHLSKKKNSIVIKLQ